MRYCYRQHDNSDCGAACLATVTRYYGIKMPMSYFRNITKTTIEGTNLMGIIDGAKCLGFCATGYFACFDDIKNDDRVTFPLIAKVITEEGLEHFVVITKIARSKVYISDPAKGNIKLAIDKFKELFTGHIVTIDSTEEVVSIKKHSHAWELFRKLLLKNSFWFITVFVFACVSGLLSILLSYGIRYEIQTLEDESYLNAKYGEVSFESIEEEHHHLGTSEEAFLENYYLVENVLFLRENIYQLLLILVGALILKCIFDYLREKITLNLCVKFNEKVFEILTHKVLYMGNEAGFKWKSGALMSRYSDSQNVVNTIITFVLTLIIDTVMIIIGGIVLCMQSRVLFCITVVTILVNILISLLFIKPIKNRNLKFMEASTGLNVGLKETIDGLEDIKHLTLEKKEHQKLTLLNMFSLKCFKKAKKVELKQNTMIDATSAMGNIFLLIVSFSLISRGMITIGTYVAFTSLIDFFITPIENFMSLQFSVQGAVISFNRLSDVLDEEEKEKTKIEVANKKTKNAGIHINNLVFRYGSKMPVLDDVTCSFPQGKHSLVSGENGCGKSTLVKLIAQDYKIESGEIIYDCYRKNESDGKRELSIVYVSQNSYFFGESIYENLRGNSNVSQEEIMNLCKMMELEAFIKGFFQGLDTVMAEGGTNFSAGERQKLAIIRALIKKPDVLILDEATSNVDSKSEGILYEKIRLLFPDITLISIMHRDNKDVVIDHIVHLNE